MREGKACDPTLLAHVGSNRVGNSEFASRARRRESETEYRPDLSVCRSECNRHARAFGIQLTPWLLVHQPSFETSVTQRPPLATRQLCRRCCKKKSQHLPPLPRLASQSHRIASHCIGLITGYRSSPATSDDVETRRQQIP